MYRTKSYTEGIRWRSPILEDKKSLREQFLEENNIQKIINYDDKILSLTKLQLEMDKIITNKLNFIDNIYRILLPIIFFSLLIVIMSYEN